MSLKTLEVMFTLASLICDTFAYPTVLYRSHPVSKETRNNGRLRVVAGRRDYSGTQGLQGKKFPTDVKGFQLKTFRQTWTYSFHSRLVVHRNGPREVKALSTHPWDPCNLKHFNVQSAVIQCFNSNDDNRCLNASTHKIYCALRIANLPANHFRCITTYAKDNGNEAGREQPVLPGQRPVQQCALRVVPGRLLQSWKALVCLPVNKATHRILHWRCCVYVKCKQTDGSQVYSFIIHYIPRMYSTYLYYDTIK